MQQTPTAVSDPSALIPLLLSTANCKMEKLIN
jgi:hypothetical protein